jgi:hypothetical protein
MTTTQQAIDIINSGAAINNASAIKDILQACTAWEPMGFTQTQRRIRDHYLGDGKKHVVSRLAFMMPNTYVKVPIIDYNWMRLRAHVASTVYDLAPKRGLQTATGDEVPSDDPVAMHYQAVIDNMGLDNAMAECERRASVCGSSVVVIRPRPCIVDGVRMTMPAVDNYWSSDVRVLPNADAPHDISLAHAVALKIAGPDGPSAAVDAEFWELWTQDEGGDIYVTQISSDGKVIAAPSLDGNRYLGSMLPILVYRTAAPSVGPWPHVSPSSCELIEQVNASISHAAYTEAMQSHDQAYYSGTQAKQGELVGGPGVTLHVGPDEVMQTISYNPKTTERRQSMQAHIAMMAVVNRESTSAYIVEGNRTVESGVARLIANEPQEKARAEQLKVAKQFERMLGAVIIDVNDTFCDGPSIAPNRATFAPSPRPAYEDETTKVQRAIELMAEGLISQARAAVMVGEASDLVDAIAKGYSDERKSASDMSSVVPPYMPRARNHPHAQDNNDDDNNADDGEQG